MYKRTSEVGAESYDAPEERTRYGTRTSREPTAAGKFTRITGVMLLH